MQRKFEVLTERTIYERCHKQTFIPRFQYLCLTTNHSTTTTIIVDNRAGKSREILNIAGKFNIIIVNKHAAVIKHCTRQLMSAHTEIMGNYFTWLKMVVMAYSLPAWLQLQ